MKLTNEDLKIFLDFKYDQYNRPEYISDDPISIPHRFSQKEDIEIAAFLTSVISWGKRKSIINSAHQLMKLMDDSPWQFIKYSSNKEIMQCGKFFHRTFNGMDCIYFVESLKNIYKKHGGLENIFTNPISSGKTMKESIVDFRRLFLELRHPRHVEKHLSNPLKNSSAKRLNMFLRWMVRNDKRGIDFGLWQSIPASMLYCPLDVHTGRIGRKLGLLNRNSNDWKSVEELTSKLRTFDPLDPVKYDFALFGLGACEDF